MPKSFSKLIPPSLYEMHELQRAGFVKLVLEGLATGAVSGFVIGLFRISYSFVNSTLGALFVKHSATPRRHSLHRLLPALLPGCGLAVPAP